ncbi:MAG: chemotaxis protein CheA [Chloroflexota bacterium]|nr:chemotaxis protein CheA [Chloroflexota bacterium]
MERTLTFDIGTDELEMFLQDADELLQAMESGILCLERASDPEILKSVFRAAHTLKAMAGAVGHSQMAELTHTAETLFDAMRKARLSPTQAITDELLATVDALKTMRDEVADGQPRNIDAADILARLSALLDSDDKGETQIVSLPAQRRLTPEQATQARTCREKGCAILEVEAVVSSDSFAPAARLWQAATGLMEMGQVIAQQPSLDTLTDNQCDGRLWLILATEADGDTIEELLGSITGLAEFRARSYSINRPAPEAALSGNGPGTDKTVRISVERLDILMNLVGELITNRTRLEQIEGTLCFQYGKDETIGALGEMVAHLSRVTDQLQEEVMHTRMLPISYILDKFPRLVRDLARAADKQVNLIIEGKATELDRSIIETIGDPLVHLLRNAVDHGVESPRERIVAGKPPAGTIKLTAAHEEGHIVITVEDDGRGIDPVRVRQAAVSHGLLSEDEAAQLDDDEATNLIFQPNLSTAEQITEVSGRGVGMDVVRTGVEQLSGTVMVESEVGRGTIFRVTLPLTLAIVQAMLVGVDDDVYAIPMVGILDSLYMEDVTVSTIRRRPTICWRDSVLPLLYSRQFFAHSSPRGRQNKGGTYLRGNRGQNDTKSAVVTLAWGKVRLGLVVDKIIGKQEIVVKSFSPVVGRVPGLSGCTILGDGCIALIIDVPGLINTAMQAHRQEAI